MNVIFKIFFSLGVAFALAAILSVLIGANVSINIFNFSFVCVVIYVITHLLKIKVSREKINNKFQL